MSDGHTLSAEDCAVEVAGRTLLAPTSLSLRHGQLLGIVGHNGSGKTTLLRCLARQRKPTGGRVLLDGRPVEQWGARPFAQRVAFLPQQLPTATGLLGRELVAMGRYPWHGALGRMGQAGVAAVNHAMTVADTQAFADRLVDDLSGGERQRLWIAMLVAQQADTMLLDEPLAALDLHHQVEVMSLLRNLARAGAAVALVVHDINMAARYCDRIVALRAGAVAADGAPAMLMTADALETIFGLPMRVLGDGADQVPVAVPR